MTALLRRLGNGLAVLAGARPDLLAAAPGARPRFVALGGVLLSTGGLALLSAAFAVHMALGASWPVALLVGLGWGAVIVNLDRMLLVGMAHDASVKRNVVLAVPRVALGLVLGIVIATPLTLQVFHREIDTEIVALQAEKADEYKKSLDADARFQGLPDLKEKVATEQAIVASGGRNDPALATVHGTVAAEQAAYDLATTTYQQLAARAQCEIDGTCGTGDSGNGAAYQGAKGAADAQAGVVTAAKARLDAALAAAQAAEVRSLTQAQADLATDEALVTSLTAEQTRLQAAFDATNANNSGILIRLEALSRLSDRSATLSMAHTMLSLLFMCIELLPVLMKVLLNFGPPSAYDKLSALRDSGDVDVEELQQGARREVEEAQAELLVMAEKDRVERQKQDLLARRRSADLRFAERMRSEPKAEAPEVAPQENGRRMWDTGPIVGLAREAAVRTVRSVRRRTEDRVPEPV
jgi:hypothetical protein